MPFPCKNPYTVQPRGYEASMASSGGGEPHFLLIPLIYLGHMNPMLSVASHLVALGCRVTFVKAETMQVPEEGGVTVADKLGFVTLEGAEPKDFSPPDPKERGLQVLKKVLGALEERQGRAVARLLRDSEASTHPISGIICDFVLWKWVSPLCRAHGLPLAVLNVWSATFFYTIYLQHKRKYSEVEDLLVSGFGLPTSEFLTDGVFGSRDAPEVTEQTANFFCSLFEGFDEVSHIILVNSFQYLEAPLLPFLEASPLEFAFIGPCFPVWPNTDQASIPSVQHCAGRTFVEDFSCMPWLDKQEKGSVLFVSFGSLAELRDEAQMDELVMGIEASGHKCLWVVRPDAVAEGGRPLEAFRERTKERGGDLEMGMFVPWAPQKKVLQHAAVGGFLTHNGWNSTVESVTFGVPMLCFPFFLDQVLHANMVHWYWKVGMRLELNASSGIVGREVVERGVRTIMRQRHASQCAAEYQQQAAIVDHALPIKLASFVKSMADSKINPKQ